MRQLIIRRSEKKDEDYLKSLDYYIPSDRVLLCLNRSIHRSRIIAVVFINQEEKHWNINLYLQPQTNKDIVEETVQHIKYTILFMAKTLDIETITFEGDIKEQTITVCQYVMDRPKFKYYTEIDINKVFLLDEEQIIDKHLYLSYIPTDVLYKLQHTRPPKNHKQKISFLKNSLFVLNENTKQKIKKDTDAIEAIIPTLYKLNIKHVLDYYNGIGTVYKVLYNNDFVVTPSYLQDSYTYDFITFSCRNRGYIMHNHRQFYDLCVALDTTHDFELTTIASFTNYIYTYEDKLDNVNHKQPIFTKNNMVLVQVV